MTADYATTTEEQPTVSRETDRSEVTLALHTVVHECSEPAATLDGEAEMVVGTRIQHLRVWLHGDLGAAHYLDTRPASSTQAITWNTDHDGPTPTIQPDHWRNDVLPVQAFLPRSVIKEMMAEFIASERRPTTVRWRDFELDSPFPQ